MSIQEKPSRHKLSIAIKRKRNEMIALGNQYGLQDQRTINCSQELDMLLNQHLLINTIQHNRYVG